MGAFSFIDIACTNWKLDRVFQAFKRKEKQQSINDKPKWNSNKLYALPINRILNKTLLLLLWTLSFESVVLQVW